MPPKEQEYINMLMKDYGMTEAQAKEHLAKQMTEEVKTAVKEPTALKMMSVPSQLVQLGLAKSYETAVPSARLGREEDKPIQKGDLSKALRGEGPEFSDYAKRLSGVNLEGWKKHGANLLVGTLTDPFTWINPSGAAARTSSLLTGVEKKSAMRAIRRPEQVSKAFFERPKAMEEMKNVVDKKVLELESAVQAGEKELSVAQREFDDFVRGLETERSEAVNRIEGARGSNIKAKENKLSLTKEAISKEEKALKDVTITPETEDKWISARSKLKEKIGESDRQANEILNTEGVTLNRQDLIDEIDGAIKSLQRPGKDGPVIIGEENKAVFDRLTSLKQNINQLPDKVLGGDARTIIQDIDSAINYQAPGSFGAGMNKSSAKMYNVRKRLDDKLKLKSDAFKEQQKKTTYLFNLSDKVDNYGLDSTKNLSGKLANATKDEHWRLMDDLKQVSNVTGSDFLDDLSQFKMAKETLKDKGSRDILLKGIETELKLAKGQTPDFIKPSELKASPIVQESPELAKVKTAEGKLTSAQSELEPFADLSPKRTQGQLGTAATGSNIENTRLIENIDNKFNLGLQEPLEDYAAAGDYLKQGPSGSSRGWRGVMRGSLLKGSAGMGAGIAPASPLAGALTTGTSLGLMGAMSPNLNVRALTTFGRLANSTPGRMLSKARVGPMRPLQAPSFWEKLAERGLYDEEDK